MKISSRSKIIIGLCVAFVTAVCASADTTTKFQTGPFTVSVDLGVAGNDTDISKPVHDEISGLNYTEYDATVHGAAIHISRFEKDLFDLATPFDKDAVTNNLVASGANKNTVFVYSREIDSKTGAFGSGYVPGSGSTLYLAGFYVSSKTMCHILVWADGKKMESAIKTIHVTEAT